MKWPTFLWVFAVLVALKTSNHTDLSWWWITSPIWLLPPIFLLLTFMFTVLEDIKQSEKKV